MRSISTEVLMHLLEAECRHALVLYRIELDGGVVIKSADLHNVFLEATLELSGVSSGRVNHYRSRIRDLVQDVYHGGVLPDTRTIAAEIMADSIKTEPAQNWELKEVE